MTHAIYIAVILVLAGVACWLWWLWARESDSHAITKANMDIWEREAQEWNDIAARYATKYRELCRDADELTALNDEISRDAAALLASLRSYKGWNGRYRRRIAELEADASRREQRIDELYESDEEDDEEDGA